MYVFVYVENGILVYTSSFISRPKKNINYTHRDSICPHNSEQPGGVRYLIRGISTNTYT